MKLYTKIINEETKEVLLINQEEAKKLKLEEMEIEISFDGKAYLKGFAPVQDIEELKQEKLKELNSVCNEYIYSIYSLETQLNILALNDYTEEDLDNMKSFIKFCRDRHEEYRQEIKETKTKEDLEKIIFYFKKEQ